MRIYTYLFAIVFGVFFQISIQAQENTNQTCDTASPVCPDNNFGVNMPNVTGNIRSETGPFYGCLGSQPRPMWFYMRVASSGYAIFDLSQYRHPDALDNPLNHQSGAQLDVDFALWGPFDSEEACDQLTQENMIDCSFHARAFEIVDFTGGTGTTAPPIEGPFNPGWVNEGEYYILLVTNYNSSGNAGYVNLLPRYPEMTATFDCSILGPNYEYCDLGGDGIEIVNLDDYINEISGGDENIGVTFHETSYNANNYIDPLPSQQTLTNVPLTVYVRKENFLTGEVTVIILSFALVPEPELQEATLTACDNDGNGLELFDLTQANVKVNPEDDMMLTYYHSQEDAETEENPITDPTYFESGPGVIYVRADAGDCYATTTITLVLLDTLELNNASAEYCDTNYDGVEVVNLNNFNEVILNNNTGTIQYYENESDAIAGNDNYIGNTGAYSTFSTTLYAHVAGSSGCNAVAELTITVNPTPNPEEGLVYEFCDFNADNSEIIDLTIAEEDLISFADNTTFYYFTQQADAETANFDAALQNPAEFELTENTVIYVLLVNEFGCAAYESVIYKLMEGVVVQNAELLVCGDGSAEAEFNLTHANLAENYDNIIYYSSQEDAENGINPINNPAAYSTTTPATVYAVVYIGDCFSTAEISLDLFEDLVANPFEYTVCDEDGNGTETFNLNDFRNEIAGNSSGDIFFYENEADAAAVNTNYIQNTSEYTTATTTLYVVVQSGSCSASTTLNLNVLDAPQANDVAEPYVYCDDFNDGSETVDLTRAFADVVTSTSGLTAEYYLSESDANEGNSANAISTPAAYTLTGTTTVYVRVLAGECAAVAMVTFELSPGINVNNPTLFTCFAENGQGTFDLTTANIAEGTTLTYHTNLSDAQTGNAPIANPAAYSTSVPGTVYVHVTDGDCVNTATISLGFYDQPNIQIPETFAICSGYSADVDAGAGFAAYAWSTGETSQSIEIVELGNYWVDVTDANGCTFRHNFEVIAGVAPVITLVEEGPNSLTITAEGGIAPYQYSVGGFIWQDSNEFVNLHPGTYNVYVRGEDGCISLVEVAAVFQWPTLFTPNGDGINDTFRVPGLEVYPGSHIRIFDRYGSLIYESAVTGNVLWDGRDMSGNRVSTQDYWYILDVGDGRRINGHITVKNRTEKGR